MFNVLKQWFSDIAAWIVDLLETIVANGLEIGVEFCAWLFEILPADAQSMLRGLVAFDTNRPWWHNTTEFLQMGNDLLPLKESAALVALMYTSVIIIRLIRHALGFAPTLNAG